MDLLGVPPWMRLAIGGGHLSTDSYLFTQWQAWQTAQEDAGVPVLVLEVLGSAGAMVRACLRFSAS